MQYSLVLKNDKTAPTFKTKSIKVLYLIVTYLNAITERVFN